MSEINFSCGCGTLVTLSLDDQAYPYTNPSLLEELLKKADWVCGPRIVDKDEVEHVHVACSAECYNRRARDHFDSHNDPRWWFRQDEIEEGTGKPPCTCTLEPNDDGLLVEERNPDCPWHTWLDRRRERRNAEEDELFAKWKDVPMGTLVFERDNVNKGRGQGRTSGPAKMIEYTFGGHKSAVIPVEDWRLHPRLRDVEIVKEK